MSQKVSVSMADSFPFYCQTQPRSNVGKPNDLGFVLSPVMILNEFPEINWLRHQANTNFQNKKGIKNIALPQAGWPNVVLNTTSFGAERSNILAPFSLFMNLSGTSLVCVDGRETIINEDTHCMVNKGQSYDLVIPEGGGATTFNIHFGDKLLADMLHSLRHSHNYLMEEPVVESSFYHSIFTRSRWKDSVLSSLTASLRKHYQHNEPLRIKDDVEYLILAEILSDVLNKSTKDLKRLDSISSQKRSTRLELMSRLSRSIDYIQANYHDSITLDELSKIACLSKYHFARTFKEAFQCTPHQYMMKIRLDKAKELLRNSSDPIAEIAIKLGFEEATSFTRFFRETCSIPPQAYRLEN